MGFGQITGAAQTLGEQVDDRRQGVVVLLAMVDEEARQFIECRDDVVSGRACLGRQVAVQRQPDFWICDQAQSSETGGKDAIDGHFSAIDPDHRADRLTDLREEPAGEGVADDHALTIGTAALKAVAGDHRGVYDLEKPVGDMAGWIVGGALLMFAGNFDGSIDDRECPGQRLLLVDRCDQLRPGEVSGAVIRGLHDQLRDRTGRFEHLRHGDPLIDGLGEREQSDECPGQGGRHMNQASLHVSVPDTRFDSPMTEVTARDGCAGGPACEFGRGCVLPGWAGWSVSRCHRHRQPSRACVDVGVALPLFRSDC